MLKKLDIYKMTVEELLETGAELNIYFYFNENYEEANKKVGFFDGLNEIEANDNDGTYWLSATESNEEKIKITAFYNHKKSRATNTTSDEL